MSLGLGLVGVLGADSLHQLLLAQTRLHLPPHLLPLQDLLPQTLLLLDLQPILTGLLVLVWNLCRCGFILCLCEGWCLRWTLGCFRGTASAAGGSSGRYLCRSSLLGCSGTWFGLVCGRSRADGVVAGGDGQLAEVAVALRALKLLHGGRRHHPHASGVSALLAVLAALLKLPGAALQWLAEGGVGELQDGVLLCRLALVVLVMGGWGVLRGVTVLLDVLSVLLLLVVPSNT